MVLTCDGVQVSVDDATSVDSLFKAHPRLRSKADALSKKKKKSVKPDGVLYARQKVSNDPRPHDILRILESPLEIL